MVASTPSAPTSQEPVQRIVSRPVSASALSNLSGIGHPVLRRVLAARSIAGAQDLDTGLSGLLRPSSLLGMDAAVDLLVQALEQQQRILVVGDFDADGATSSALMVLALRAMGADRVEYLVPNRFEFGYGLTPEIVAVAATRSPGLIITVDNGISSISGVEAARRLGVPVLVTDHHLPGASLPAADAIVNPNQPGDNFPSKALAGVGVAFYVVMALRQRLESLGWFERGGIPRPNLAEYLDLVALGTVADLVPLDRNNRILVQQGLLRIRSGQCRAGIRALIEVAGRNIRRLVTADFGFAVGPRLNAAGRLDDMSQGIECLLSDTREEASALAQRLDALNRERREIESDMKQQAMQVVQRLHIDSDALPLGLCLYDAEWHQGVIGILASRIKERFHRPVIAFARSGENALKGSARSIPGLHIRDALDAIAAHNPQLLQKFGGHAMAAGLSLAESDLPAFQSAFEAELGRRLAPDALEGVLESDGQLGPDDFDLELSELLRDAAPWGQGFPEPLFDGEFTVISQRVLGGAHLKMAVRPDGSTRTLDAVAFNQASRQPETGERVRLVYRLDSNEYRGALGLQLIVTYMETPGRAG
jgi:single-stranded-DNA-specific exonuclease